MFLFSITWGAVSGWWALACLALGLLYAWLLYRQPVSLSNTFRYSLFALRAVVITIIAFLLLAPLLKSVTQQPQKPLVLILQDNSESLKLFQNPSYKITSLPADLDAVKTALGDNYEVHEFNFDRTLHDGLSNKFKANKQIYPPR